MVNSGKREAPYNLKKRDGLDATRNGSLYDNILVFMLPKKSRSDNPKNSLKLAWHVTSHSEVESAERRP